MNEQVVHDLSEHMMEKVIRAIDDTAHLIALAHHGDKKAEVEGVVTMNIQGVLATLGYLCQLLQQMTGQEFSPREAMLFIMACDGKTPFHEAVNKAKRKGWFQ